MSEEALSKLDLRLARIEAAICPPDAPSSDFVAEPTTATPRLLWNTAELGNALGIGKTMVHQLVCDPDSELPRIRFGNRLLFPAALIPGWIEKRAMKDTPPPIGIPYRSPRRRASPG